MKKRILLVEDDRGARMALAYVLEGEGHAVAEAGSLAEGRALIGTEPFDWVISDYHLPDGLGTKFLAEVSERHPEMRRLLMSAGRDPGGHTALFMEKPCDIGLFRSVFEDAAQTS